jgi:hypothetical protein
MGEDAETRNVTQSDEIAPVRTADVIRPRGRCPFAAGSVSLAMTAAGA